MKDDRKISIERLQNKLREVRKAIKIINNNLDKKNKETLEIMEKYGVSETQFRRQENSYSKELSIPFHISETNLDRDIEILMAIANESSYGINREESTIATKRDAFRERIKVESDKVQYGQEEQQRSRQQEIPKDLDFSDIEAIFAKKAARKSQQGRTDYRIGVSSKENTTIRSLR